MKNIVFNIMILFLFPGVLCAQSKFSITGNKKHFKLSFQQVNNLVVIPVELNGKNLSFLLDTGVNSTLVFHSSSLDSLKLDISRQTYFKGMGADRPLKGIRSEGNTIKIGKAINKDFSFYLIDDENLELSTRMGIPIDGIIGYDFFKSHIVEFNYVKNHLEMYNSKHYRSKSCRKCDDFKLSFYKNKPYLDAGVNIKGEQHKPVKLLIDSGSSEAVWLFKNEEKGLEIPHENFPDFLGHGFGGSIYGWRVRIAELNIGSFKLQALTASFPDSLHIKNSITHKTRDGSIGGQVLRRFRTIIDYPGSRLRLKPNRNFNKPFEFDMSGIAIAHAGYNIVSNVKSYFGTTKDDGRIYYERKTKSDYELKPRYKIVETRPDSPAWEAGLRNGDIIHTINGKSAHNMTLQNIIEILSSGEGKKIKLLIERDGIKESIRFKLERII